MLWDREPLPAIAERLGALGVEVVVVNPCAHRPAVGDYLSTMRDNAAALAR